MTAPLNEGAELDRKILRIVNHAIISDDPPLEVDAKALAGIKQLIATAERAAQAEGADKIITIFHNNHTISDAAYADMATTIASWRLAELSGEETTDNG